jgi:hypothetical protein
MILENYKLRRWIGCRLGSGGIVLRSGHSKWFFCFPMCQTCSEAYPASNSVGNGWQFRRKISDLGCSGSITPSNAGINNKFSYIAQYVTCLQVVDTEHVTILQRRRGHLLIYHKVYINLLQNLWTGPTIGTRGHPYGGSLVILLPQTTLVLWGRN